MMRGMERSLLHVGEWRLAAVLFIVLVEGWFDPVRNKRTLGRK
jgi:hypothetical protein